MEDARQHAQNLARRLQGLVGDPELLRKAVARELARHPPAHAGRLVHHLIALAGEGSAAAARVLPACVAALGREAASPVGRALAEEARALGLADVVALFTEAPPLHAYDASAAARSDAKVLTGSLGHMKQAARLTRDPDVLARLVTASEPSVVRNALLNPRLTEPMVVRMAARRPARPEPLREIWLSARWGRRPAVRRALVFNPYLPPEVASKLVPLLPPADLAEVAADAGLHADVRGLAAALLAQRRGEGDGGGEGPGAP